MISYDFPRILGKSGVYLIQPPKMCAGLQQALPAAGLGLALPVVHALREVPALCRVLGLETSVRSMESRFPFPHARKVQYAVTGNALK